MAISVENRIFFYPAYLTPPFREFPLELIKLQICFEYVVCRMVLCLHAVSMYINGETYEN